MSSPPWDIRPASRSSAHCCAVPPARPNCRPRSGCPRPGQLYHHLRALGGGARIVEQESRNHYRIAAAKVVPLLVIILAAADVGEHPL